MADQVVMRFTCAVIYEKEDRTQEEARYGVTAIAADIAAEIAEGEVKRSHPKANILYSEAIQL